MPQMNLPLTVVISSLNQKELVMQALMQGASAYFFKLVHVNDLQNLVKQYIGVLNTKGEPPEELQTSEPTAPERDAARREAFSLENQQRKKKSV